MPSIECTAEDLLRYRSCDDCRHAQASDSPHCERCGSVRLQQRTSQGLGSVLSFTTVHRAPSALFRSQVPYTIVLAAMDEGFQRMAHAALTTETAIGQRIRLVPGDNGVPMAVEA